MNGYCGSRRSVLVVEGGRKEVLLALFEALGQFVVSLDQGEGSGW